MDARTNFCYRPPVKDIMNYFRAIMLKEEHSQRALDLTALVMSVNSSNYTAW